ncbi:MAG: O-antigen ligase family protein [Thermodesulfovibrionales bacterium]
MIFIATALIIFSVLFFGSVEVWSTALFEAGFLSLFMIRLILREKPEASAELVNEGRRKRESRIYLALAGILFYAAIQTAPMPSQILKMISPRVFDLYSYYAVDKNPSMHISLYAYKTQVEFLRLLACSLCFTLFATGIKDARDLDRVLRTLAYFGFGLAVFSLLQTAAWNGKLYWFREITGSSPFGPFVNRNHYAGLIGLLIPLSLGLAFTRKSRERQLLFGFMGLIMSVSLFLSLSRGGIISFFAGLALFTLLLSWNKLGVKKRRWWPLAAFIFILFSYLLYLGIDPVIDRFYKTDISKEARFAVWAETLRVFKDFYLTGCGLGTFVYVFPLYSPEAVTSIYDHAHNDYLEFILEAGITGVVLLLTFLFFLFNCIFGGTREGYGGIIRISMLSAISTMAVHSIFDFNLHIPSNALMLSAILGMALANSRMGAEISNEAAAPE